MTILGGNKNKYSQFKCRGQKKYGIIIYRAGFVKKVALDLDGVVFDSENLYRVYTEIYDVEKNKKDTIIDNTQRIFQKKYNWTEEKFKEFYNENAEKVLTTANFMTRC